MGRSATPKCPYDNEHEVLLLQKLYGYDEQSETDCHLLLYRCNIDGLNIFVFED